MVRLLLSHGANVKVVDTDGGTAWHFVPYINSSPERKSIAQMPLDRNANLSVSNQLGHTPLHLACAQGCEDVAELLIGRGAAINARDSTGWTPLHLAGSNGRCGVVRLLIRHNADHKVVTDDTHETALLSAICGLSNEDIRRDVPKTTFFDTIVLLGSKKDSKERKQAVRYCDQQEDLEALAKLLEFKPSEIEEVKLLWFASRKGYDEDMCVILEHALFDTSIKPKPSSALEWAAYHGNAVVTWWILKTYSLPPDQLGKA